MPKVDRFERKGKHRKDKIKKKHPQEKSQDKVLTGKNARNAQSRRIWSEILPIDIPPRQQSWEIVKNPKTESLTDLA